MRVLKRDGSLAELDLHKIHKVLAWACEGNDEIPPIKGVSISQVEMAANLQLHDKISTADIQETLIEAAANLITEDTPNYDQVAGRLVWFAVRKEAFASNKPPHLLEVIKKNIGLGYYTPQILETYTEHDIDQINDMIVHTRDDHFKYAGAVQMRRKYLVQDRVTKKVTESFQFPYIMVAATLFSSYPRTVRLGYVKEYYDFISAQDINEPTPVMAGVRTKLKQFSSCVVMSVGDDLNSINKVATAIVQYASRRAGLGVDIGRLRAEGQPIRNGEAVSTGVIPFAKYFNAALKSCSQGAIRGAAATFNFPFWHLEFMSLIELKNEKGAEEKRLRTVDYSPHFNRLVFNRWATKGNLTLFSPEQVPGLWELFYSPDVDAFEALYTKYESDPTIKKFVVKATDLMNKFLSERSETTRIYPMFADTVNTQTSFYQSVSMSNLCMEICLPTLPLTNDPSEGLISLCTLGAINVGRVGSLDSERTRNKLARICELIVRAKDALLSYQDYPLEEARRGVESYRPLGIGFIGFSHWLAKNRLTWGSEETLVQVNRLMEFISYHLIKTSIDLAEEFGPCQVETKYSDGWMPFDDSKIQLPKTLDWDLLRNRARKFGIRNATLTAFMPSETSSVLANETNGLEPPRKLVTNKGSKDGSLPQVVPEISKLRNHYQTLWDVKAEDYIRTIAVLQHYNDQAISANTSYDPNRYPKDENGKFPMSVIAKDFALAYKLGLKTLYYHQPYDQIRDEEPEEANGCDSGACAI